MSGVIGIVIMVICWIAIAALNNAHRDETGVNLPTGRQYKNIRRNARRKGVSLNQASDEWLSREQRKQGVTLPAAVQVPDIVPTPARVDDYVPYKPKPYPPEMFKAGATQPPPFSSPYRAPEKPKPAAKPRAPRKPKEKVQTVQVEWSTESWSSTETFVINAGVQNLDVRVAKHDPHPDKPGAYQMDFEFNCTQCGGWMMEAPDHDHEQAICKACRIPFGTYAAVKAKCNDVGLEYMKAHRLGAFADRPSTGVL